MEELLEALAKKTQENMKDEATAVLGYTEQAAILRAIKERGEDVSEWEAINDELIADELNHQQKLNALYTAITGIAAKND